MPDWEERISRETAPALRAEHELRYQLLAPLVAEAELWCDLGCGNGVAAARLQRAPAGQALLVDVAADALAQAVREVRGDGVTTLQADLATADGVARVRSELIARKPADGTAVVTCFETVEHLASFLPLVELLTELAEQHGFTVALSVPNDAFWSIVNPHHQTAWGEGAFEELRRVLPASTRVLRQVALQGSAIVAADGDPEIRGAEVALEPGGVPSHMLAVFGPQAGRLHPGARVVQVEMEEQRRWERQRESDIAQLLRKVDFLIGAPQDGDAEPVDA